MSHSDDDLWKHVLPSPWELVEAINRASGGDWKAARLVLNHFVNFVDSGGKELPRPLLEYLADCFRRIDEDEIEVAKALNLTRPRGRPKNELSKLAVAEVVRYLRDEGGESREDALEKASDVFKMSADRVEKICKELKLPPRQDRWD